MRLTIKALVLGSMSLGILACRPSESKTLRTENIADILTPTTETSANPRPRNLEELTVTTNSLPPNFLSNGMQVPQHLIRKIEKIDTGRKFVVDTGYGFDFDLEIFDEGDGKPYTWCVEGVQTVNSETGELKGGTLVKKFKLTYKFTSECPHGEYPIWEPTAFRADPCYGL